MKTMAVSVALALCTVVSVAAHAQLQGPDVSGTWNRESASGGWGPRIEIMQSGSVVSIQSAPGKTEQYSFDGKEKAEVISVKGCFNQTRITRPTVERGTLSITTWIVTKSSCFHGEVDEEPIIPDTGAIDIRKVPPGLRKLESITLLSRDGDVLTVETTRSAASGPTTTTATYRK